MNSTSQFYREYLLSFSKDINNAQNNLRAAIYGRNDKFINEHNEEYNLKHSEDSKNKLSYFLRHNQFSDLTKDEISSLFLQAPVYKQNSVYDYYNHSQHTSRQMSQHEYEFSKSFSWSSSNNWKKRPVTGYIRNQGLCGGCWAFVSVSCTEASIAINNDISITLSVQELMDCDTEFDRGCNGGNPINAFRYITNSGLTTADKYPLMSQQAQQKHQTEECRDTSNDPVRGSIKGFSLVTPYRQDLMMQVLRSQGPLSIGVCGADESFLYYGGGVYNPDNCCTTLNHAMMIVGHGTDDSLGLDYWIAQNSWGTSWGEQGYIRMFRSTEPGPGLCGLALTPSVPVGGYLSKGGNESVQFIDNDAPRRFSGSIFDIMRLVNAWVNSHWREALLVLSTVCLMLSFAALIFICVMDCISYRKYRHFQKTDRHDQRLSTKRMGVPRDYASVGLSAGAIFRVGPNLALDGYGVPEIDPMIDVYSRASAPEIELGYSQYSSYQNKDMH